MPRFALYLAAVLLLAASAGRAHGQEPPLPAGLGGAETQPDPAAGAAADEPALPAGLGGEAEAAANEPTSMREPRLPFNAYGFWDVRAGMRTQDDPYQESFTLGEARLQLGADRRWRGAGVKLIGDILYDPVADEHEVDLNRGEGWVDLRQANVSLTPLSFLDLKLGRQILTWGTGDLVFINDNFPKDWRSFFTGRDVEYLKAPSDALKGSFFTSWANMDVVYTPQFDADRFLTGRRLSLYNPALGRLSGDDAVLPARLPDDWFTDDEWAVRLYGNVGGYELAVYGYDGFWKSPGGRTADGKLAFPALAVYGGSARGTVPGGIGNAEFGYFDSRDDPHGTDPAVKNSEWRALLGYERDLKNLASDLTLGLQYYLEHMRHYAAYRRHLPAGVPPRDEDRHLCTFRITKLLLRQNLELSLFLYYSPSDRDGYARPRASYKVTDHWQIAAGGNMIRGDDNHTFFGQLEDNSNVYVASRYSF